MEVWKDVKGYEGLYQVSNYGNVKSLRSGKKIALNYDRKKYLTAHLCNKNGQKRIRVHRLVAEAFIPNEKRLPQVNHIDENKNNNYYKNLEWCDNKYNSNYGTRNKKISNSRKIQTKKIYQFSLDGDFIKEWENIYEILSEIKIQKSSIYRCCEGLYKQAGGYVWKYEKALY